MSKRTLLDIMEQIDDDLIEEAAHPEFFLKKKRTIFSVRGLGTLAACMTVAVGLVLAAPYMMRFSTKNTAADLSVTIQSALAEDVMNHHTPSNGLMDSADSFSESTEETVPADSQSATNSATASLTYQEADKKDIQAASMHREQLKSGDITFYYSNQTLISAVWTGGEALAELVLPDMLGGKRIVALDDDFWSFVRANPDLRSVTIPADVVSFGDISVLDRTVEIVCAEGSAAAIFFAERGYTVRTLKP